MSKGLFDITEPIVASNKWDTANPTDTYTMITGGYPGGFIAAMVATNSDTIAHTIKLAMSGIAFGGLIETINVPAGAGYGTTPAVDVMAALPAALAGGFVFTYEYSLTAAGGEAVGTDKLVGLVVFGGMF